MFLFATLARKSKKTRLSRAVIYFLSVQALLILPVLLALASTEPGTMYSRLYNGDINVEYNYLTQTLIPLLIIVFNGYIAMQLIMYLSIAWLFGQMRRTQDYMTMGERFTACAYASLILCPIGLLLGFFAPILHLLIFEMGMVYVAYKIIKEY